MKLLYLTTEDSTFWSHRLALAQRAQHEGVEVVIMTRWGGHCRRLEQEGFRVIPWRISRKSLSPWRELNSAWDVFRAYRREKPDLVHHIALKPIVYGAIASWWYGIPAVHSVTGLGPVFQGESLLFRLLRFGLRRLLAAAFGAANCRVVFQNEADRSDLLKPGIVKGAVVPGFGVDTERFAPSPESDGEKMVVLPARMLWEKGVKEFVEASEELRRRGLKVRMVLVGSPDPENPGCIPDAQLAKWTDKGLVEWWGHRDDMPAVLRHAHVICLPSYREGLPKVLAEAAASGRPIVATAAPGCSCVVADGVNGLLVPTKHPQALANALETLLGDQELRARMGRCGRERAVREFSEETITCQILAIYEELLAGGRMSVGQTAQEKLQAVPDI